MRFVDFENFMAPPLFPQGTTPSVAPLTTQDPDDQPWWQPSAEVAEEFVHTTSQLISEAIVMRLAVAAACTKMPVNDPRVAAGCMVLGAIGMGVGELAAAASKMKLDGDRLLRAMALGGLGTFFGASLAARRAVQSVATTAAGRVGAWGTNAAAHWVAGGTSAAVVKASQAAWNAEDGKKLVAVRDAVRESYFDPTRGVVDIATGVMVEATAGSAVHLAIQRQEAANFKQALQSAEQRKTALKALANGWDAVANQAIRMRNSKPGFYVFELAESMFNRFLNTATIRAREARNLLTAPVDAALDQLRSLSDAGVGAAPGTLDTLSSKLTSLKRAISARHELRIELKRAEVALDADPRLVEQLRGQLSRATEKLSQIEREIGKLKSSLQNIPSTLHDALFNTFSIEL